MLSEQTKKEIFEHLKRAAEHQHKVRNCEVEGLVYPIEEDFQTIQCYRLMSFLDEDRLREIVKNGFVSEEWEKENT